MVNKTPSGSKGDWISTNQNPFAISEIIFKYEVDLGPNNHYVALEYLDKVVKVMIMFDEGKKYNNLELKIPLVWIKVKYTGFSTINPQDLLACCY